MISNLILIQIPLEWNWAATRCCLCCN